MCDLYTGALCLLISMWTCEYRIALVLELLHKYGCGQQINIEFRSQCVQSKSQQEFIRCHFYWPQLEAASKVGCQMLLATLLLAFVQHWYTPWCFHVQQCSLQDKAIVPWNVNISAVLYQFNIASFPVLQSREWTAFCAMLKVASWHRYKSKAVFVKVWPPPSINILQGSTCLRKWPLLRIALESRKACRFAPYLDVELL